MNQMINVYTKKKKIAHVGTSSLARTLVFSKGPMPVFFLMVNQSCAVDDTRPL